MRSGPGTEYRRVKQFAKGTPLDVDGVEYGWYRILDRASTPLYVHGDFVAGALP